jgi:N-acetylglutamate synthase-like GNAT family acetyltransferase
VPKLDFHLRPARESDQGTIKAMIRRAQLNPFGLKWRRFTVGVDDEDCILGCIQLKPHNDGTDELASLVVSRKWRGRGIASALVVSVQGQAKGGLWLMCRRSLTPFYERFAFNVIDDPNQMSSYYRRIWWLARIFSLVTRRDMRLAIMQWHSFGASRLGLFGHEE